MHQAQGLDSLVGAARAPSVRTAGGRLGAVLVIDDTPAVRRVAARMLEKSGFDVLTAAGGEEALELVARPGVDLLAVVLDASMPKMSGEATFHALRDLRADLPIVICTGHSELDAERMLAGKTRVHFLPKPFTISSLTGCVRDAIEIHDA